MREALEAIAPDVILIEGPPEADETLPLVVHAEMQPPVALLVYAPDDPQKAVYYPFAVFSPEWQAIQYGVSHNVPVRFMDLPQTHWMAIRDGQEAPPNAQDAKDTKPAESKPIEPRTDPLGWLAKAAGYADGERWWEQMIEQRRDSTDLFAAILEAMTALRADSPPEPDPIEPLREAHMRRMIRLAEKEGSQHIAVVCGAWHGPVLATMPKAKEDDALLKGLPKLKVEATWVPWTYSRLMYASGYGAGVESPGWYEHLWKSRDQVVIRWLSRVAELLRGEDLDASTAQVIDAVRLAESLAAMRGRPAPGLPEISEAIRATLCFGSDLPMTVIHDKLIVGEVLGEVPPETPMAPLQGDLQRQTKRLRLKLEATEKKLDLDLRQLNDLERSHLLHRLALLGLPWGKRTGGSGKGTFHEYWTLKWQPEYVVVLIERSTWGNIIADATTAYARRLADIAPDLPTLTALVDKVLLCELPDAAEYVMEHLKNQAALTSNVLHLMGALPPLARVLRYGNVRQTDSAMVSGIVDGLVTRICIGLPGACASLNDEAAAEMFKALMAVHAAISLLQVDEQSTAWYGVLRQLADQYGLHGLIAGRCSRLLLDSGTLSIEEVARRMGLALSTANEPEQAGAWIAGFLEGSGLILLHNDALWSVLDNWVMSLREDAFIALLPLLRRTVVTFTAPERREIGERASRGIERPMTSTDQTNFDVARAEAVLPLLAKLLGLAEGSTNGTR